MTIALPKELRTAVQRAPDRLVEIEDPESSTVYVLMTRRQFETLVYDDSDLSESEMLAAAAVCDQTSEETQ
jgi:hypothetical protein